MIAAQGLVALIYVLRRHPSAWSAAAPWWTVYGTLVDAGCLALMMKFTRPEGIRLRDLVGKVRLRWGRDIFLGIGCFLIFVQFFSVPGLVRVLPHLRTIFLSPWPGGEQDSVWDDASQHVSGIVSAAELATVGRDLQPRRVVADLVADGRDDL